MKTQVQSGTITGFICTGTRICGDWAGSSPANPCAETPTMVMGELLTRIFLPMTAGSRAKRFTQ